MEIASFYFRGGGRSAVIDVHVTGIGYCTHSGVGIESIVCACRCFGTLAPKSDVWPLRKLSRSFGCLHPHIS